MITARATVPSKPIDGLLAAKQAAGSAKQLAKLLKISGAAVSRWQEIPLKRLLQVEQATGIPREILRPDLFITPKKRRAA